MIKTNVLKTLAIKGAVVSILLFAVTIIMLALKIPVNQIMVV
jgi:hypothetical protein